MRIICTAPHCSSPLLPPPPTPDNLQSQSPIPRGQGMRWPLCFMLQRITGKSPELLARNKRLMEMGYIFFTKKAFSEISAQSLCWSATAFPQQCVSYSSICLYLLPSSESFKAGSKICALALEPSSVRAVFNWEGLCTQGDLCREWEG